MSVYVDTSAFVALANANDPQHANAVSAWQDTLAGDGQLLTCSYAVCETISLIHSRHGTRAVRRFVTDLLAPVRIEWVGQTLHDAALTALLIAPGKSGPSLADSTGLELIPRLRIDRVFAYDRHLANQGLNLVGLP